MFNVPPADQRKCADDINRSLTEKKLHVPSQTFPLAEAAAAIVFRKRTRLNKAGTLSGKIVLMPCV